ncbi:CRISPR-associated protein Csx16 [Vibrio mexicanus]|uniref:CRISPR-associated protein Csx16 n=1 Tax=Vibrio mexicanus TaxID=1004326 RepID=UPI00063CB55D|nr:CRISPR-associated protein Csx16 [Vibrio mexicanus]
MKWFVSRHTGAKEWAKLNKLDIDVFVDHLELNAINKGDTIIGTLPIHLAEQVCSLGARYLHLSLNLPLNKRGTELTAQDMIDCRAQLTEYQVVRIDA